MKIRLYPILLLLMAAALPVRAMTMAELRQTPGLTPEKFEKLFAGFEFKFHAEVQPHDVFLATQSGDCDDFATVAADVLARHGYTPRMIAIRMKGETHVVCYITEEHGYLDYNTRKDKFPIVPCDPDIKAVAEKVAEGFRRDWVATYEFTYDEKRDVKLLVHNIIPNPSVAATASVSSPERYGAKR